MLFWSLMLIIDLLLPLLMIGAGYFLGKFPPEDKTTFFAYKSKRSIINDKTFEYGNKLLGNMWFILGAIALPFSIFSMIVYKNEEMKVIGIAAGVIIGIEAFLMLLCLLIVEVSLRHKFDKDGNIK